MDYRRTPIPELYAQARRLPGNAVTVCSDTVREMEPPDPAIHRVVDLGCGTGALREFATSGGLISYGPSLAAAKGSGDCQQLLKNRLPQVTLALIFSLTPQAQLALFGSSVMAL